MDYCCDDAVVVVVVVVAVVMEDDAVLGLYSLAISVAKRPKVWIGSFYGFTLLLWGLAGFFAKVQSAYGLGLFIIGLHFVWQVYRLDNDNAPRCLALFKSNFWVGLVLMASFCLGQWIPGI